MDEAVSGQVEEIESDYFQSLVKEEDGMDLSYSSTQGGGAQFPTFTLDQSSSQLQGSQGFMPFVGASCTDSSQVCLQSVQDNIRLLSSQSQQESSCMVIVYPEQEGEDPGNGGGGKEADSGGAEAISWSGVKESDVKDKGSADRSPKCKASPKRRVRRSRTSSNSESQAAKVDNARQSVSPHRAEQADGQASTDLSFKPSLLDEVLTEKKLALMRSPEVMKFLQEQQAKLSREKKLMYRPGESS